MLLPGVGLVAGFGTLKSEESPRIGAPFNLWAFTWYSILADRSLFSLGSERVLPTSLFIIDPFFLPLSVREYVRLHRLPRRLWSVTG